MAIVSGHLNSSVILPPAARNLFIKRFLDFQKFFIKVSLYNFLRVSSRFTKMDGESGGHSQLDSEL